MDDDDQPSVRCQFEEPVDVLTTLDRLGIEHLEVSNERTIIIYTRTIFNFEVPEGRLDDARTVSVEVFDPSPDVDTDTDRTRLIESLVEDIATTAQADWGSKTR